MIKAAPSETVAKTPGLALSLKPTHAVVDVGSGSVKVTKYAIGPTDQLIKVKTPDKKTWPTKLARGMTGNHNFIRHRSLLQTEHALLSIRALLDNYEIKPENTYAIGTEALRAVQGTVHGSNQIQLLQYALGNVPLNIITGEEESILVGTTIVRGLTDDMRTMVEKHGAAFAAIGGGSTEVGFITTSYDIRDPVAIPYGIETLKAIKDKHHKKTVEAGRVFKHELDRAMVDCKSEILCVMGGNWRSLGGILCQSELPATLQGKGEKQIRDQLVSATHRTLDYYRSHGEKIAHRAEYMGLTAAMLLKVFHHVHAKKIFFLDGRIGHTLAAEMHIRNLGPKAPRPLQPGLERLFAPSVP